ncbi:MAG TPA: flagellar motor protein MotB [Caldithrix sp.]|nr:flagellar motor protein MotB [Caldithrix sp.]
MASKRAKKNNNDSGGGGGAPGWMVTYGDLMSLLLCFFVLLVSFSSIEMAKFQKALGSLKGALGVLPRQETVFKQWEPVMPQLTDYEKKRTRKVISELRNMVKGKGISKNLTFEATDDGIIIRIDSPILYNSGEAEIKPRAFPILDKIMELTADWSNSIRIEGHTDNIPIHNSQYPSNWELSTARALSVLRYFLHSGKIEPQQLAAVGYGKYHPLVPNTTAENRAKNRRVEIYIVADKKQENYREAIF